MRGPDTRREPGFDPVPATGVATAAIAAHTLGRSGLAVVVATHNMDIAARMDRRVTIREGLVEELD